MHGNNMFCIWRFHYDWRFVYESALFSQFQRIIDNGMGSKNNLVSVKKSDFEVFQALAMDSESMGNNQQREWAMS